MRRQSYKGTEQLVHTLPIDAASTMGIMLVVGTMLPSTNLSRDAVLAALTTLRRVQGQNPVTSFEAELPSGKFVRFEACNSGKFSLNEMKPLFKKLGVNFSRLLVIHLQEFMSVFL